MLRPVGCDERLSAAFGAGCLACVWLLRGLAMVVEWGGGKVGLVGGEEEINGKMLCK